MARLATMTARLARLEERSRPEPPVRFVILGPDDEGAPGPNDEGQAVVWFTIRLDRPGSDFAEEDLDA
jgi:hypothetical protein